MNYDWKNAEYPCFGITDSGLVVCFSSYQTGHVTQEDSNYIIGRYLRGWDMAQFKPYTPPKEKTKLLWYWEYIDHNSPWSQYVYRLSEAKATNIFRTAKDYRKIEALGCIEDLQ